MLSVCTMLFIFYIALAFAMLFKQMLYSSCISFGLMTQFVYFHYYYASCTVLLVSWPSQSYVHTAFVHEVAMYSMEK